MNEDGSPSFEDALRQLEDIVRRLENGDVPLDESISLFEKGNDLRKQCQQRLDSARARIEKIGISDDGTAVASPLDPD